MITSQHPSAIRQQEALQTGPRVHPGNFPRAIWPVITMTISIRMMNAYTRMQTSGFITREVLWSSCVTASQQQLRIYIISPTTCCLVHWTVTQLQHPPPPTVTSHLLPTHYGQRRWVSYRDSFSRRVGLDPVTREPRVATLLLVCLLYLFFVTNQAKASLCKYSTIYALHVQPPKTTSKIYFLFAFFFHTNSKLKRENFKSFDMNRKARENVSRKSTITVTKTAT